MIKLLREDGKVFDFTDGYGILSLEGVTEHNVELSSVPRAVGHGDIITGKRLGSRIISLEAEATRETAEEDRHEIRAYFNPFKKFKVYIDYKGERVWQECEINSVAFPTGNIYEPQRIRLSLYCPEPWWNGSEPEIVHMYKNVPMFGFPLLSPAGKGFAFGIDMYGTDAIINNTGDLDAYCRARFNLVTLPGGQDSVSWFKLMKSRDEYIQINKIITPNERWEIDFDKRLVTCNGENANRFVDNSSTFFTISQGGSSISYTTSDVKGRVDCVFTMYRRYL